MTFRTLPVPKKEGSLNAHIEGQFREVSEALNANDNLTLVQLHEEPQRPRVGMVVLADGTNWNPGNGAGFYGYRDGAWRLLG